MIHKKDLELVINKQKGAKGQSNITPEFKKWLDGFMVKNHGVLEALAQLECKSI